MNIIELARLELKREGKLNSKNEGILLLNRIEKILSYNKKDGNLKRK